MPGRSRLHFYIVGVFALVVDVGLFRGGLGVYLFGLEVGRFGVVSSL